MGDRVSDQIDLGDEPSGDDRAIERSEDELLASYAESLADGVELALPAWVSAAIARRLPADQLDRWSAEVAEAGRAAAADIGERVRELVRLDIDEQWTNPLSLIRAAIRYPNEILSRAGVRPVERDAQAVRFLPDDVYDLAPASFADLSPDLHDVGIGWGAAKAHVHLRRRRQERVV